MRVEPTDRHIASWARGMSAPCYYVSEPNMTAPCLKVQCGHLTAYFRRGRLIRLWAYADCSELEDMFKQLTQLFRHCGTGQHGSNRNVTPALAGQGNR